MTVSIANRSCSPTIHIPYARIKNDKALAWIYESLESHTLSQKLKCLLTDREHVNSCYEVTAFLQNEKYVGAFLLCLNAIENNQPNLLTQIDIGLYKSDKAHKRSTSHPDFSFVYHPQAKVNLKVSHNVSHAVRPPTDQNNKKSSLADNVSAKRNGKTTTKDIQLMSLKLRPWSSLPDMHNVDSQPHRKRCTTMSTNTQPIHIPNTRTKRKVPTTQKVPSFTYKQNNSDSGSTSHNCSSLATVSPSEASSSQMSNEPMPISLLKCDDIQIHVDRKYRTKDARRTTIKAHTYDTEPYSYSPSDEPYPSDCYIASRDLLSLIAHPDRPESLTSYTGFGAGSAPADFVSEFIPQEGEKIRNRYGRTTVPDFGYDIYEQLQRQQRPSHSQSLTSFLQAAQCVRANTELERENAHFSVSEAMISAIEQIKWRRLQETKEHSIGDSEVNHRKMKNHRHYTNNTVAKSVESGSSPSSDDSDSRFSANNVTTSNLTQTRVSHFF